MGFWRAKQGLSKTCDLKTKDWSHLGEKDQTVEEKREREKKRKRKRRRREEEEDGGAKRYGTLDFVWN